MCKRWLYTASQVSVLFVMLLFASASALQAGPRPASPAQHLGGGGGGFRSWGDGTVYFFRCGPGNHDVYYAYDVATRSVAAGPLAWTNFAIAWPQPWGYDIDATVNWGNGKAYIFRGDQYVRYDIASGEVDGGPVPIIGNWPGWPSTWTHVDAAVRYGSNLAIFFSGNEFLYYDVPGDSVVAGYPKSLAFFLPASYFGWSYVTAAANPGDGNIYLLHDGSFIVLDSTNLAIRTLLARYFTLDVANWPDGFSPARGGFSLTDNTIWLFSRGQYIGLVMFPDTAHMPMGYVSEGPSTVAAIWAPNTWPKPWGCVDTAVNWGTGKAYFFSGSYYLRLDIFSHVVDPGYPAPIIGYWPNWPTSWDRVDSAINWGDGMVYFFYGPNYLRYDMANDRVVQGYPLPILGHWPGWPQYWDRVTAATDFGDGKAYFFLDPYYLSYDIHGERVDPNFPQQAVNFPGYPDGGGALRGGIIWGLKLLTRDEFLPIVKR